MATKFLITRFLPLLVGVGFGLVLRRKLRQIVFVDEEAKKNEGQVIELLTLPTVTLQQLCESLVFMSTDNTFVLDVDMGTLDNVKAVLVKPEGMVHVARYVRDRVELRFPQLSASLGDSRIAHVQSRLELERLKIVPTQHVDIVRLVMASWKMPLHVEVVQARAMLGNAVAEYVNDSQRPILGWRSFLGLVDIPVLRYPTVSRKSSH